MSQAQMRVGFAGLGLMGRPMVRNLLKAGFPLVVCDRIPAKTEEFAAEGIPVAATPRELAGQVDVVITMIGTVADELEAVLGEDGVLAGARPGLILIDSSTVGIAASQQMAQAARAKGVAFLDAAVLGSTGPAKEGKLRFMVGGDREVFEKVRPVLQAMSEMQYHMGPNGAGSAMKMVANLIIGMTVVAEAEAFSLGCAAGLKPEQMLEVLGQTSVSSTTLNVKGKMMVERQFAPMFALKYMQKDFDLITEASRALRTPTPVSAITHQLYMAANAAGYGEQDYAAVIRLLEDLAGRTKHTD